MGLQSLGNNKQHEVSPSQLCLSYRTILTSLILRTTPPAELQKKSDMHGEHATFYLTRARKNDRGFTQDVIFGLYGRGTHKKKCILKVWT